MRVTPFVRRVLAKADVELTRYSQTTPSMRRRLIERNSVELVLDVGANAGQYARQLREAGFRGRIISFEPLQEAFKELLESARSDPNWECLNVALGETEGELPIHVAGNLQSSSFLPMHDTHVDAAPESVYTGVERVAMATLDAMATGHGWTNEVLWLKMDVQGYESKVLAGATSTLPRVAVVELEMSLVELYEGQEKLPAMIELVESLGFRPVWLERGYSHPETGEMLQVNGLFVREEISG